MFLASRRHRRSFGNSFCVGGFLFVRQREYVDQCSTQAALQCTIERKMEHSRAFEQAQRLAGELVQVSQGTLKRYNESWEDCKVVLHDADQVPGVNLELEVREKDVRISGHTNCLPHDLARLLVVWLPHYQRWHGEYQRLASQ